MYVTFSQNPAIPEGKTLTTITLHPVAKTLRLLIDEVAEMFPERRRTIEAIFLAILSREHAYLLGQPGTGKSLLLRTIMGAIKGAGLFEALLSKTRPGEAILGPYNIPRLRDEGVMVRNTEGYLPKADFGFLDELFKMSPTTGHDLLAIMNERRLHQVENGKSYINVPLSTLVGAGNEVEESSDGQAAWDRILVRDIVEYIKESSNWIAMLKGNLNHTITDAVNTIPWVDLKEVITTDVPAVKVPNDVYAMLAVLKEAMRNKEIIVSDRRWGQSLKLLQASAFLAGRTEATVDDIQVLRHSLWETPEQISVVERLTLAVSNPTAEKALSQLELAEEIAQEVRDSKGLAHTTRAALATQLNGRLLVIKRELESIRNKAVADGASTTKVQEVTERVISIEQSVAFDLLEIDPAIFASLNSFK